MPSSKAERWSSGVDVAPIVGVVGQVEVPSILVPIGVRVADKGSLGRWLVLVPFYPKHVLKTSRTQFTFKQAGPFTSSTVLHRWRGRKHSYLPVIMDV